MKKLLFTFCFFTIGFAAFSQCSAGFTFAVSGNTVTFTNTSSTSGIGTAVYAWTFGDLNVDNTENPSHTYAAPGTYYVCLTLIDALCSNGTNFQYCDSVTISGTPPPCFASFSWVANGLNVQFTNTGQNSSNAFAYTYQFHDLSISSQENPTFTYSAPGTYQVCLYIVDFSCNPGVMQYCDSVTVTATDVNALSSIQVNLFPNPASNQLFLNGINTAASIEIIDIQGKCIQQFQHWNTQNPISLHALEAGYYFLKLNGTHYLPFVVSKH
jgi:PKD repeat protein